MMRQLLFIALGGACRNGAALSVATAFNNSIFPYGTLPSTLQAAC
jgi:hypothetical protein